MRECIKPEEMCCVALRCFASGKSFRSLEYQFRISRKAIMYIVEQVAAAIIKILGEMSLKTPNTIGEQWVKISQKFKERWNFPNGLGGIDGKHIVLQQPKSSGSHYRNYKGTDSIILLAMVGTEYEFLFDDVGMNGRNSDLGKLVSEQFEEWFREKHIEFVRSNTPPWSKLSFTIRVYGR